MERPGAPASGSGQAARRRTARVGLRARGPPLIAYVDTSALVKLLIDEPGSRETREALLTAATVATSDVSYVEARAALARMRAGGRIGANAARAARRHLDGLWLDLLRVAPDDELLANAADLADIHSLRGYDSMQLATAALLEEAGEVEFLCWDRELAAAAGRAGLRTAPFPP